MLLVPHFLGGHVKDCVRTLFLKFNSVLCLSDVVPTLFRLAGSQLTRRFRGCNDDPVYGKITALKNDTVIDQCAANGHTAYSVPGLVSADIYCCDKDACNAETPAFPTTATVPAMATTVGGNGGGGGGGDQHRSASSATVGLFTVAAVVAVSAITRTML